ncbi:MAG TPA: ATP-binding cassette domain-containing protein [Gemmatimonadaceae bacterium]|jgi:ABC-type lipoprotein export system ATPase subunit|nr:ATP-binding cassette domain-containing protein [Gemmatimonadaceae bacterium]
MTAIRLRGVCPTGDTEWCQTTDIAIADGAFFVIRTTPNRARRLARLVLGLDAPAEGTVEVLGLELQTASRAALDQVRRSVGSVLQPDGLLGTFTLEANLALAASVRGALHAGPSRTAAREMLTRCGLGGSARQRPGALPPDVRETAALARALVCRPAIVVLDDPISAVKSRTAFELYQLCREIARTVVILTHRRNDALYDLADVVALWDSEGFRTDAAA